MGKLGLRCVGIGCRVSLAAMARPWQRRAAKAISGRRKGRNCNRVGPPADWKRDNPVGLETEPWLRAPASGMDTFGLCHSLALAATRRATTRAAMSKLVSAFRRACIPAAGLAAVAAFAILAGRFWHPY